MHDSRDCDVLRSMADRRMDSVTAIAVAVAAACALLSMLGVDVADDAGMRLHRRGDVKVQGLRRRNCPEEGSSSHG